MKLKKLIFVFAILLVLSSIGSVVAADADMDATNQTKSFSQFQKVITNSQSGVIDLNYDVVYNHTTDSKMNGMKVTKNLVINANGHTFDGKGAVSDIFIVGKSSKSADLTINNAVLKNANSFAIDDKCPGKSKAVFTFNNCNFTDASINIKNNHNLNIDGCKFSDSTNVKSLVYGASTINVSNTLVDEQGECLFNSSGNINLVNTNFTKGGFIIDAKNLKMVNVIAPDTAYMEVSNKISGDKKLIVSVLDNNLTHAFLHQTVNLTATAKVGNITVKDLDLNFLIQYSLIPLHSNFDDKNLLYYAEYTPKFTGNQIISACLDKKAIIKDGSLLTTSGNSFHDLNIYIEMSEGEINLTRDTVYDRHTDKEFVNGIEINRDLIINGNGYSIDACNYARIFNVINGTLTINNLTLENGAAHDGGAIFVGESAKLNVSNSEFIDNEAHYGGAIYISQGSTSLIDNCLFEDNSALVSGGAIVIDSDNCTVSNCKLYDNCALIKGGAISVYRKNNLIIDSEFKHNNACKGTAIWLGSTEGTNLTIINCTNVNKKCIDKAAVYLNSEDNSLANVDIVVLGNSTVLAEYGDKIILTADVYSGGLTVTGGNLTFFDGYKFIPAFDLGNGTYIAKYKVKFEDYRTISAQFNETLNENLYSGAIDSRVIDLTVNDVIMYYKNGIVVAQLFVNGQPFVGETVQMTVHGVTYDLTTNEKGFAILPITLIPGNYDVYTIYNLTYRYVDVNSSLIVEPTIEGDDLTLYYCNGSAYEVRVVDGLGQPAYNQLVKINVHGVIYDCFTDADGVASLPINLNPGNYTVTAENTANGEVISNTITVLPTIVGEDLIMYERNGSSYSVKVFNKDGSIAANAAVRMNVHGVYYDITADENGTAYLPIRLNVGEYIITTEYDGCIISNKITVLPVLIGEDITLYYCNGTNYAVNVLDGQGNPLAGVDVTMDIHGVLYDRTTDATGVATLPITLNPGNYIITTTYKDHITSNTVTVLAKSY